MLASRRLSRRLATLLLLLPAVAVGQTLELLGPTGVVSPDGFEVSVVGVDDAGVVRPARDAELLPLNWAAAIAPSDSVAPLRSFHVVPNAGVREVVLNARSAGQTIARRYLVGPPQVSLSLALSPAAPVKGRDLEARLTVTVTRQNQTGMEGETFSPPLVVANVGTVSELKQLEPGRFEARYVLPDTRYPEVAVLVAFAAWPHPQSVHGAIGTLLVPLPTAIDLPGRTEPNASMSIEIAGQTFGPVESGPEGRFELPVVVPPGSGRVFGTAIDKVGNKRRREIDLMLPKTDQLACVVSPASLPADGSAKARVVCATTDPTGKRVTRAKVAMTAERGTLTEMSTTGEYLEWRYQAPRGGPGAETLRASYKAGGPLSKEELLLRLVQGPAANVALKARESRAHLAGTLPLVLRVTDGFGGARAGATVSASVVGPGAIVETREGDGGTSSLRYRAPEITDAGTVTVVARAFGPAGAAPARLTVSPSDGGLVATVMDLAQWPVPAQSLSVDGRTLTTGADGQVSLGVLSAGAHEIFHRDWPGLRHTVHVLPDGQVFPAQRDPLPAPVSVSVPFAPPVPVNVRLELSEGRGRCWAEDSEGKVLPGRSLSLLKPGVPAQSGPGPLAFAVEPQTVYVSCADVASGVTAVAGVSR